MIVIDASAFTAYDAAYVALAETLDAPLLTRDQRIAGAAGHHAQVELVRKLRRGRTACSNRAVQE
jgi:hypothetical protein